ncbi:MAG TPA: hypothetical protein VE686_13125 [Beijerinckiaceae bacterium]|nr:hypothetical protein [Beijerinckiaceae bacterium]
MAKLEAEERDRCGASPPRPSPPASPNVRSGLAEQQGELIAQVIRSILGDLGLNKKQQDEAPAIVRRHLLALAG